MIYVAMNPEALDPEEWSRIKAMPNETINDKCAAMAAFIEAALAKNRRSALVGD